MIINMISQGGGSVPIQTKTVTPTSSQQTVVPDTGYLLSSVTVNAISYTETLNSAGGYTVRIG